MRLWRFVVLLAAGLVTLSASDPERITRVENGLLPGQVVKGAPVPRFGITERLAHYKVPGASVAVFENGDLAWARGYGVVEAGSPTPVTPSTLFQAASISKPVAAVGAMILVERGKLALDEPVNARLRSWKVAATEVAKAEPVTLRRLLSHTAGLTVHGFRGYASDEPVPTLLQLLNGEPPSNSKRIEVDILPGSRHRYSGGGFSVAQQLVVDVSGKPFPDVMRELVLIPAGMRDSTYEQPLPGPVVARAASGHRATGKPINGQRHIYPEMAAAGLWTTPTDLARFALAMQKAWSGGAGTIVSRETAQLMLSPQPNSPSYGLGFGLNENEFGHGGSNEGFRCILVAYKDGRGAAVMTNGDRGAELAREILHAISAEYGWPGYKPREREVVSVAPATLQTYVGDYQFPAWVAAVALKDGKLSLTITGQGTWELLAEADDRFFSLSPGIPAIRFVRDAAGSVTGIAAGGAGAAAGITGKKIR
jgi:CubicO group peptidase (beta-lactamase class C family)